MTPTERTLVADLFDRLAKLENAERDPQAERAIAEGLAHAPNAIYPLVQTVLLQDQALKDADARIRELENGGGVAPRDGGFLDGMRDTMFGRREQPRGSVPSIRPGVSSNADANQNPPERPSGYGSFLGTAAASAAGVIGGALLLDSIRSMMGRHTSMYDQGASGGNNGGTPWQNDASGGNLAREAGVNDIGGGNKQSLFGNGEDTSYDNTENDANDGGDFGDGLDFGGGDYD